MLTQNQFLKKFISLYKKFFFLFFSLITSLVQAQWTQLGGDINGENAFDNAGRSVSISSDGSRIAVGAFLNNGNGSNSGHVRVFQFDGSTWVQLGSDIDGEAVSDLSGRAISLSANGNRLAVGAHENDANGGSSGHVRAFEYNGSAWIQLGSDIDGEDAGEQSGGAVAISGDGKRVAIGAILNSDNGTWAGQVRIYEYNGSAWVKLGSNLNGNAQNRFGQSVSMSQDGKRVAIGSNIGNYAKVFEYNGSAWVQIGANINGENNAEYFGHALSLSSDGNRLAIGALDNDGNGDNSGHVRVYSFNGSAWVQMGSDIDGEAADQYTIDAATFVSLSPDGYRLAIGANLNDGNGSNSGHARVYTFNGSNWIQYGSDIDGEAANDQSGVSVSLSNFGSRVIIGGFFNDENGGDSGHSRVWQFTGCVPPVIICPNNIVDVVVPGTCGKVINYTVTSSSNCTSTLSQIDASGKTSGSTFSKGVTTQIWKITDSGSNTATCSFTVTINDNELPKITCPINSTVNTSPGLCQANVCYLNPSLTDNCPPATPVGYTFRTSFGNSYYYQANALQANYPTAETNAKNAGGHLAVITSSAENAALNASGAGFAWIGGNDLVTDGTWKWSDCETFSYSNFCSGEPNGGTFENYLEFETGGCWNDLLFNALRFSILEIEGAKLSQTAGFAQNAAFPKGVTTNTFMATDASGNTATCSFTITVNDTELPGISCPSNIVMNNTTGTCGKVITYTVPVGTDNCPSATTTQTTGMASGATFPVGVTTNTFKVTDASGNTATCSFTITVNDTELPTMNCPTSAMRGTEEGFCKYTTIGTEFDAAPTDNCGITAPKTYSYSGPTSGSGSNTLNTVMLNKGLYTIQWNATDVNGNTNSCTFTVEVKDNELPKITCPANKSVITSPGQCTAVVALGSPSGVSDNCGAPVVTNNSPGTFPVGVTVVTWTATDASGNTKTCTQNVTVIPYKCGNPVQVFHTDTTATTAKTKWKAGICATTYELRIRQQITPGVWGAWSSWSVFNGPAGPPQWTHQFTGLNPNKFHNYQIRTKCGISFSASINDWFWTLPTFGGTNDRIAHSNNTNAEIGIEENPMNLEFVPNPASDFTTVLIDGFEQREKTVTMFDLYGKLVFRVNVEAKQNQLELDLTTLGVHTGVYLIRVSDDTKQKTEQLMIER